MSYWFNDAQKLLDLKDKFACRIRNLDNRIEFIMDELGQRGMLGRICQLGSNKLLTVAEFEKSLGFSPLVQQVKQREVQKLPEFGLARKKVRRGWLWRLSATTCVIYRLMEAGDFKYNDSCHVSAVRNQRVMVRSYKKRSKEFSAFYMRQDIPGHEGSILTMKFCTDDRYLASAGEDQVVRVWQVIESDR